MSPAIKEDVQLAKHAKPEEVIDAITSAHKWISNNILSDNYPAQDLPVVRSYENSLYLLGEYATLDWQHCKDIFRLMQAIRSYAFDTKLKRPLNVIMHAEPGSGKSHFVKCLSQGLKEDNVAHVTADMTSTRGIDDLLGPIDEVRNLKSEGKFPILFLDEFDSNETNYALLLPLLWEGRLTVRGRTLSVGKLVIILAGSKDEIGVAMQDARMMQSKKVRGRKKSPNKLPDLVSRINGGELKIPSLDDVDKTAGRNRRVDKVCLTISLLRQRFGSDLTKVPWALLNFVSNTKFQHGVRSIANLVDTIERVPLDKGTLELGSLKWPIDSEAELNLSHLPMHVIETNGPKGLCDRWGKLKSDCPHMVQFGIPESWSKIFKTVDDLWLPKITTRSK